jgi:peptide-methionine (S)-S-oxide reductase
MGNNVAKLQQRTPASVSAVKAASPPTMPAATGLASHLALGAGCYWGTEKYIRQEFQKSFPNAIMTATVGFMSPHDKPTIASPTYDQVCTGRSGHIEVLFVELRQPEEHFEELIRFFFQFHDPTTKDRQGNDRGFQYASWIFCADEAQVAIANRVRGELQSLVDSGMVRYEQRHVSTNVTRISPFTPAQAAHQDYLAKHPNGYCNHRLRFKHWPMLNQHGAEKE